MAFIKAITVVTVVAIFLSTLRSSPFPIPLSVTSIIFTYLTVITVNSLWRIVLAPSFSPFNDLPTPDQGPWYKRFLREPHPGDLELWINEIPNDGERWRDLQLD